MQLLHKIIRRYHSLALPVKASLWFAICSIIQKGIQFITVPIFTRLLTTSEFGEVSLYGSWMGFFVIFITLNLNAGTFNTGMVKYEDEKHAYTSAMQSIVLLVGGLFVGVFLLWDDFFVRIIGLEKHYLILMFSQVAISASLGLWTTQQQYMYHFKSLFIITLLIAVITPALGIWAVRAYEDNVAARIYSMAAVQLLAGIVFIVYNYVKGKTFFNKEYWKFALVFAIPLIPHYLSSVVLAQADRVMIDWYCSKSDVGIYSVAYSLSMVLMLVVTSINQSLVPWTFRSFKRKDLTAFKQISAVLPLLVVIPIVLLILLAPEVIALIAPVEYYAAIYAVPPVATSCFFIFLYSLFGNIEFYYQKKKYIAIASVVGATLNIVLNFILIPIFGYLAAAYTTLICYIGFSMAHYLFSRKISLKELGVKSIYKDKMLLLMSIFLVGFTMLAPLLYGLNIWWRYCIVLSVMLTVGYYRNGIKEAFTSLRKKE